MYRGVIEVSLDFTRSMCNAENDPFYYESGDEDEKNFGLLSGLWQSSRLVNPSSNLDPDELALYALVLIFATLQLALTVRYFMRLQKYFDRLQEEIRK